jgi:hypothetical protein
VATELARDLRQNDRKVWLAEHLSATQQLLHEACYQAVAPLQQCQPFLIHLGGGWPIEKQLPAGTDMVTTGTAIQVAVSPHDYQCLLLFGVVARGREFGLIRALVRQRETARSVEMARDWDEPLAYNPERPPPIEKIAQIVRASISLAMRDLHAVVKRNQA